MARDAKLEAMVDAMADACSFAEEAEPLRELPKPQSVTIDRILQQVLECTFFINGYCKKEQFGE